MEAAIETTPEPTHPNPPRWWWTKRLLLLAVILTLGLGIAWNWWAHEARRRVEAEVAAIRARGEPLEAQDFEVAPVPDELNAALSILAAIRNIPPSTRPANQRTGRGDSEQYLVSGSQRMRSLARTARFQLKIVWSTNVFINPPAWNNQTSLPRTLLVNAVHEHESGNDAEAIEILRDMLFVTDSLEGPQPNLLMHLLAMVNGEITFDAVATIAPDLQVMPAAGATTLPSGPASREQVGALIRALLDDQDMQRGLARGFQAERAHMYSALSNPANRSISPLPSVPAMGFSLTRPWVELEVLRIMQSMDALIAAAEVANLQAERAALSEQEVDHADDAYLTSMVHLLSQAYTPKFGARLEQQLETLASRRIAAIRLAIRLYQLDHNDEFPARLDELVPNYLPAVPLDPAATGGKPFTYSKSPQPVINRAGRAVPLTKPRPPAPATTRTGSQSSQPPQTRRPAER